MKDQELHPFDAAAHLQDEATIRAYLQAALDDPDPAALLLALQNATRALQALGQASSSGI